MEHVIQEKKGKLTTPQDISEGSSLIYKKMQNFAFDAFSHLVQYGNAVELSVPECHGEEKGGAEEENKNDVDNILIPTTKRDYLCSKGKQMWMLIRKYPEFFADRFAPSITTQQINDASKEESLDCAVASG